MRARTWGMALALPLALLSVAAAFGGRGETITVEMTASEDGFAFVPAEITASRGDVIRFVNRDGTVHNVSFPKPRNRGAATLPAASPFMTAVGESWDLAVTLPAGAYNFQCDPHAGMGMTGKLTVK